MTSLFVEVLLGLALFVLTPINEVRQRVKQLVSSWPDGYPSYSRSRIAVPLAPVADRGGGPLVDDGGDYLTIGGHRLVASEARVPKPNRWQSELAAISPAMVWTHNVCVDADITAP